MTTAKRTRPATAPDRPRGAADASAPAAFEAMAAALRADGGAEVGAPAGRRRAFRADALTTGGKIFAMCAQGTLVLELPAERVGALVADGHGERFDPGRGRPMREWIALRGGEAAWLPLAREARAFVGGAAAAASAAPRAAARRRDA